MKSALGNIRRKLEKDVLLRSDLNNPYVEKYVDNAIIAILNELPNILREHDEEHDKEIEQIIAKSIGNSLI